jgi:hypothetical protein
MPVETVSAVATPRLQACVNRLTDTILRLDP